MTKLTEQQLQALRVLDWEAADLVERLQAENEELRKDAERYRWLREYYSPDTGRYASEVDLAFFESDEVLDAAIDAAMQGGTPT